MSAQNLIEKIARHTVTEGRDADVYIRRLADGEWQVQVVGGCKDTYNEQVEAPKVTHYQNSASMTFPGTEEESLKALLRRVLDFVRTETPVPA